MNPSKKQTMHVVSATHWDREWIIPFEGYLAKLVDYTDDLLRMMEADPEFKHYQMDGQSICMKDYLAVRPERTEKVRELVRNGRLLIGPWYTLPDMNLNYGEAIVRNLLVGIQAAKELGGAMMEGYTACSNGQIAQLPQIYAGFGMKTAIIYKGIRQDRLPREFIWRSPDGSEVLTLHLSLRYGRAEFYCLLFHEVVCNIIHDVPEKENWAYTLKAGGVPFRVDGQQFNPPTGYKCLNKPEDFYPEHLKPYLQKLRDLAGRDAATSQLIVFHGMDHTPPFASTPRLIAAANGCFDDLEVVDSSLPEAMAALSREIDRNALKVHEGELRDVRQSRNDRNTNIATLSARMDVKIANREAEHALIDQTEPFCAWAWLQGGEYNDSLMNRAWKLLLANHGHDSIDSCSMDKVNRDVLGRYTDCQTLCEALTQKALGRLVMDAQDASKKTESTAQPFLTIFNPGLKPQSGLCEMMVDLPNGGEVNDVLLVDESGEQIVPQVDCESTIDAQIEWTIGRPMACTRRKALFEVKDVPAMGWLNLRIMRGEAGEARSALSPETRVLENDYLRVRIRDDGRLDILCKETGREQKGGHYFVDRGDIGDPWNFTPTPDKPITSIGAPAEIKQIENGHLRAAYRIKIVLDIPASGLLQDEEKKMQRRKLTIVSEISLARSAKRLDIKTTIENSSKYHKLVACFPTGLACAKTYAGGQFDVMERPIALPDMSAWGEPITGYPNYGFAGLSNGKDGYSLLNVGLPEYFVEQGKDGNVLTLTLLRAVQLKSGWPEGHASVEQGHCLGKLTCHYAIYPHAGDWKQAGLWQAYREFAVPLACTQYFGTAMPGKGKSMIQLEPATLEVSCVKKAENGAGLVIRVWNPLDEEQTGVFQTAFPIGKASYVDFNETPRDNEAICLRTPDRHTLSFRAGSKKIVTVKIEI